MQIGTVQATGVTPEGTSTATHDAVNGSFAELLQQATSQVNQAQQEAEKAARDFALGEAQSIHNTIIEIERADLSLRLLTQVRNKVVEAYQEIMRMQI
jgi:flagellar hook-basal body complex protein FliE